MESVKLRGTGVVSGFAYAPVAWTRPAPVLPTSRGSVAEDDRPAEVARFKAAAETVAERFTQRASAATGVATEVLGATAALARDRGWLRTATKAINAGSTAEVATTDAIDGFIAQFEKLGGVMAERTTDLRDIRNRVIAELLGLPEPGVPQQTSEVILCAEDLAPADTASLDPTFVRALVTRLGGPTSHTAIIARQLGIPCVVAAATLDTVQEGAMLLVDGTSGILTVSPDPEEAQRLVAEDEALRAEVRSWSGPAATADGTHVQVLANVQDGAAARKASASPAEGVGLFRTELCFLTAKTEPSVAEQAGIYGEVFAAFPDSKVVVRTLDAGSDKPVPFANHEEEENPALGVRGIRLGWTNPGIVDRQLDAIAQAAEDNGVEDPWVMAPMIATVDEAFEFAGKCRERNLKPGIMIEVPAAALLADQFLAEVDFFSIGTNDLTQYTMAADRMSSKLATLTDPWQPAVLRLIKMAGDAGTRAGKPVGVCGEAAADPLLACVLIGLGITSLSMATGAIPAVGVQLGKVTMEQCREAAQKIVEARNSRDAKELARTLLS
ncbi:phosphoenolpyruvate--protein phosphotransferase [Tessaracoccus bendigoensis DSM 12906]|uniref:Phosphoenolpyruvate-protein phosphotransferase n=1 Tax=Tessaracoccus bendigoensis DSM 12906 TaxID=1123357 RepID=A0A1M6AAK3_9ACTN|nr:phosphoenolpyruvate--protein phosphotransferase [Tessaracoccus bendigoensis]SHI33489.1 phosphoenolpyruvate--protein phosphotransferase [Tessaracoccus bendigoensis DSM 12906]